LSCQLGFGMALPVGTLSQVPEEAKLTAWKVQSHGKKNDEDINQASGKC